MGFKDKLGNFFGIDDGEYDEEVDGWIPAPIREFEPVNYWEVQNAKHI